MYLKEIRAVGFKSFAEKIDIEFTDGISGIVGPNGSGKSNVVDAVRWVLGEQSVKQLRGEGSMSDVIFSGSKSRKGSTYASVTLIFDNSDKYLPIEYEEVAIKRTIYKSGENEYSINNEKCRLKDILELFTDTGASKESFNIISQGDIGNILSSKPEDRRIIFEDASGTLKYKKRKDEALRKLSKTHDNMTRVNDIIDELNTSRLPLKEQSEKAKKYNENKSKLENIEIALIVSDVEKYNFDYKFSKEKVEVLTDELANMLSSSSNEQALIEKIKNNINNLNNELYASQQKLVEITSKCERLQGEKNLISERSKYNSDDVKVHDNILSLKERILELDKELAKTNSEIKVLDEENKVNGNELNNLILKLSKIDEEKNKLTSEINLKVRNLTELKSKRDVLTNSIENNSLLPFGVKNVLNNPKLIGINGVVGKLIEYEEKYSTAIDIALGGASSYIVCDTETNAKDAVNYLKSNNLGRATFFPINTIKERFIDNEVLDKINRDPSFISIAKDLVNSESKYKNIVSNLLGNVIVVKDLDSANKMSKVINNKYRIVTLDGDIVNVGGSITGGAVKNKNSILNEKYELENTIKLITKTQDEISELENRINEIDETYSNIEDKKKSLIILSNSKNEIYKGKLSKIEELNTRKSSISLELNNNLNVVNNVITKEEEKMLDDYYDALKEKDSITLKIEEIKKDLEKEKEELTNNESLLKMNNSEYNKLSSELKKHEITINRLDVKLDNLLNILSEEYSITYEYAKANYVLEIDSEEARKEVSKLKSEIKSLGPVNLGAIEEYERVNTRYEFLEKQKEDLEKAEDMLLEIIKDLDEVMKEKFSESFTVIQEKFSETFKELFGGGDARLELTDPNNILETGIDIIAHPPGKKLSHISLLSGGEKTLTAISLLFAILKTRPVPFCILDEVEAALDEVNVDNFGKFLGTFRNKTQFIVITHKKKTMEYADVLYGITMQESGVSKLVSVRLEEIK